MFLLSIDRATIKQLLTAITARAAGPACNVGAPCHERFYDATEDPQKADRCQKLCTIVFPEALVLLLRERNADEARLGFLLYHVALAAQKRASAQAKYKEKKAVAEAEAEEEAEGEVGELVIDAGLMARVERMVVLPPPVGVGCG